MYNDNKNIKIKQTNEKKKKKKKKVNKESKYFGLASALDIIRILL